MYVDFVILGLGDCVFIVLGFCFVLVIACTVVWFAGCCCRLCVD